MKRSLWGISLVATAILTPLVKADTLLHRQVPWPSSGVTSDTLYTDDVGHTTGAQLADSFSLAQPASICRINWWGFYGGFEEFMDPLPPATESMRVRFYTDSAGLPGEVLQESTFVNANRTWTGRFVALSPLRKEYLYQADLPQCLAVLNGTIYWLEVAQIGDVTSRFDWESSNIAGGFAQRFPLDEPWELSSPARSQLSYELWTPEPASGALLVLGCGFFLRRGKR